MSATMTSAAALRTRCRRCQYALPEPAEDRRAFCCRGCHRQFYAAHCRVCDKPSLRGKLCSGKCSYAHQQNPNLYTWQKPAISSDGTLSLERSRASRNPYKTSLKARAGSWGPTLPDDEFWLATLELDATTRARLKRANDPGRITDEIAPRSVLFRRNTPPLNIIGGYRFPGALAVDLAEPQFTPAFDRVPEHHADHASTEAA